jgi:hypothetical protein
VAALGYLRHLHFNNQHAFSRGRGLNGHFVRREVESLCQAALFYARESFLFGQFCFILLLLHFLRFNLHIPPTTSIMTGIKFYGSQVGSKIKLSHPTSNEPISLLYHDILTALKSAPGIIYIFWPIWPALSGDFCELAPTRANFWAIFLHVVLFMMQVPFVLSVPLWILLPGWTVILGVAGFMALNKLVVYLLNGPKKEFHSGEKFAKKRPEHEGEEWVFMNGVAAGYV